MRNKLLFPILALFVVSCTSKTDKPTLAEAEQVIENFTAFESNNGKRLWDLNAKKAFVHESENNVLLKDFKVRFYKKNWETSSSSGQEEKDIVNSVITAKTGRIDTLKNDFFTEGETLVNTSDKETLECSDLSYISAEKKIFSDSKFVLYRKDSTIKGEGLEASPDLSVVIVKHNKAVIEKDSKK